MGKKISSTNFCIPNFLPIAFGVHVESLDDRCGTFSFA
jgi:hypothetical protein